MTPIEGRMKVTSKFGIRILRGKKQHHYGIDIVGLDNKKLRAIWESVKTEVSKGWNGGRGNMVILYYNATLRVIYQHLNAIYVLAGTKVKQGNIIGLEGWSGDCVPQGPGGSHLHIEVQQLKGGKWVPVEPSKYIEVPNSIGVHKGNNNLDKKGGGNEARQNKPVQNVSKYKKGDKVVFSTGYMNSTDTPDKALHVAKKQISTDRGIVSDVLSNGAPNPLKIVSKNGKSVICWCNDGDIRGRW